ncbi:ethanolamine two-component sensor histidine kinase [Fictibacillus macauensis ZFHKF-1]|uniref:histidine kinase n=1 Tax=Fictibacillus macauensis ZFHKF-1 TaxID=1196324 RepID=I8AM72_9BACL|nr:sensor histidine kinase [Fictibacillus macauensis]EIT86769.1 ethanolamine two-component sensor histidine kinase [Fictibacillus macauensis ZFHKF-1]
MEPSGLYQLCRQYTDLEDEAIALIQEQSQSLQTMADLSQSHVFIDCIIDEGTAIVVAEAIPRTTIPIYKEHVTGKCISKAFEPAVFRSFKSGKPVMNHRAVTPEGMTVSQNVLPIIHTNGTVIGVVIAEKDITAQIQDEKAIETLTKTTEEMSRTVWGIISQEPSIPDVLEEGLLFLEGTGEILYANNYALRLMENHSNASSLSYKGKKVDQVLPFITREVLRHSDLSEREEAYEGRVYCKRIIRLRSGDNSGRVLLYIRDISDLREKERQLVVKSAVIKEIHHRVKNNLQTVASLLRLQLRRGVPEEAKGLYQESLNRIVSIATVHEYLSYSGIEEVDIKEVIQKVSKMLVFQAEMEDTRIHLELQLDAVTLPSSHAVSLALVVTELLQNSLKHGYQKKKQGSIEVKMVSDQRTIQLFVKDDGDGMPLQESKEHLGLEIVRNLTTFDLGGQFTLSRNADHGTTAYVEFRIEQEDEHE